MSLALEARLAVARVGPKVEGATAVTCRRTDPSIRASSTARLDMPDPSVVEDRYAGQARRRWMHQIASI